MNYRHAFHAGNFADVVKHVLLTLALVHLRKKESAFRVIDSHAGTGRTNLESSEAVRGGEWQGGIGRIWDRDLDRDLGPEFGPEFGPGFGPKFGPKFGSKVEPLLAPYREALRSFNPDGALRIYPGSPLLIAHFLRDCDRLNACELEPGAAKALARNLRGDPRVKAIAIDGWTALTAYIPPKERRGLLLIDPPFEERDELSRLADTIATAHAKWRTGMMLAWYPIKDAREIAPFIRMLSKHRIENSLRIELVCEDASVEGLRGTGMIAVHPPFTLAADAKILLPALAGAFWPNARTGIRIENLGA